MSKSHWLLVIDLNEPSTVIHHYMDDDRLEQLGIAGKIGDEYKMYCDDEVNHRVVGEIGGLAASFLDAAVCLIESVNTDGGASSQGLRYNAIEELVDDVVLATKRAAELQRTKA